MARKTTGSGDRGLAEYIRLKYPHLVAEARVYWSRWLKNRAKQARQARREQHVERLENQIAELKAKLKGETRKLRIVA